jgi:uncharacterized glyoxalase superfamily protein PhnB
VLARGSRGLWLEWLWCCRTRQSPFRVLRDSPHTKTVSALIHNLGLKRAARVSQEVFDGVEITRLSKTKDDRFVVHATMVLGQVKHVLYDDAGLIKAGGEKRPCTTYLKVSDAQAMREKAISKGFTPSTSCFNLTTEAADMFWGDTMATVTDPFGHVWCFGSPSAADPESEAVTANAEAWRNQHSDIP